MIAVGAITAWLVLVGALVAGFVFGWASRGSVERKSRARWQRDLHARYEISKAERDFLDQHEAWKTFG